MFVASAFCLRQGSAGPPAWTIAAGALALAVGGTWWQLARTDYFCRSPLADAHFENVSDLGTGSERQLTTLPADFDIQDVDVSPDGREIILERVQEQSSIVLIDVGPRE